MLNIKNIQIHSVVIEIESIAIIDIENKNVTQTLLTLIALHS